MAINTARDFAALISNGNGVTQAHADYCAANGHAKHTQNGLDTGVCPRCGEVTIVANFSDEHDAKAELISELQDELDELECEGHESLRGDAMGMSVFCPADECVAHKKRALRRKLSDLRSDADDDTQACGCPADYCSCEDFGDPAGRTIEYYRQS